MTTVHGQRIGLLINPTAGKHRGEQVGTRVADLLEAGGRDVVDLTGLDASRAHAKAAAAIASGSIDMLVVAGGDGAAGLGANICAGTDVPLGIVAVGTGNDNARELGLPVQDVDASVDRILNGQTRRVDLGRVLGDDGQRVRDYIRLVPPAPQKRSAMVMMSPPLRIPAAHTPRACRPASAKPTGRTACAGRGTKTARRRPGIAR